MAQLRRFYILACFVASFLSACDSGKNKPEITAPEVFSGLTGVFQSEGYGIYVNINYEDDAIEIFDISANSCILDGQETLTEIANVFEIGRIDGSNDEFIATPRSDLTTFSFQRLTNPVENCLNGGTQPTEDPERNFDIFFEVFSENYAFFSARGVDWPARYELFRPEVTNNTSREELFLLLSELVSPLEDIHVSIQSEFDNFNSGLTSKFLDRLTTAQSTSVQMIIENRLDSGLTTISNGGIGYGTIDASIGYVQINSFNEDETVMLSAIDSAIDVLRDSIGIIVDVRNNTGGSDHTALRIANRFADQVRPAFMEQAINGNSLSPVFSFNLTPEGPLQYLGPVAVLAGATTVSAAENFVLNMLALPQVTIIGEDTNGTLSTVLEKSLPNGFEYSLANELEMAPDGSVFEVDGILPDINVENFTEADILAGVDSTLETAINFLD